MAQQILDALEHLFQALSDKTRLRLLALMADGEVSVGFLADSLGESQPKISRHLAYLRGTGLVSARRDGKWIYYGIAEMTEPSAEVVLRAALQSLTGEKRRRRSPGPPKIEVREESVLRDEGIYAQPDMIQEQWQPTELDVFLL